MFTDNYDSPFCFWVFDKRLAQENCFLFCKKYEKESIILTVSFQLEKVPFTIKSYCFERNDCNVCSQTIDSSFCFWVFEKRLTQENCFLFCKKYGLFNGFIFLTIKKFLLSYFPNFHGQRSGGGQDLSISHLNSESFQPWRGFVQRIYTQTVLLEMSYEISG